MEPSIAYPRPVTQFRQQLWWLSHYKEVNKLNPSRDCKYHLTRQNVDVSNADSLDDVQSSSSAVVQASRRAQIYVIRGLYKAVSLATNRGILQDIMFLRSWIFIPLATRRLNGLSMVLDRVPDLHLIELCLPCDYSTERELP